MVISMQRNNYIWIFVIIISLIIVIVSIVDLIINGIVSVILYKDKLDKYDDRINEQQIQLEEIRDYIYNIELNMIKGA